jgi:hypothetical protein
VNCLAVHRNWVPGHVFAGWRRFGGDALYSCYPTAGLGPRGPVLVPVLRTPPASSPPSKAAPCRASGHDLERDCTPLEPVPPKARHGAPAAWSARRAYASINHPEGPPCCRRLSGGSVRQLSEGLNHPVEAPQAPRAEELPSPDGARDHGGEPHPQRPSEIPGAPMGTELSHNVGVLKRTVHPVYFLGRASRPQGGGSVFRTPHRRGACTVGSHHRPGDSDMPLVLPQRLRGQGEVLRWRVVCTRRS